MLRAPAGSAHLFPPGSESGFFRINKNFNPMDFGLTRPRGGCYAIGKWEKVEIGGQMWDS